MAKKKSVLVIGAVGPLGSYLTDEVERHGYRVKTLIWNARRPANLPPSVMKLEGKLDQVSTLTLPLSFVDGMIIISGENKNMGNLPMEIDFASLKNLVLGLDGRKIPTVLLTSADGLEASNNHITPQAYFEMRISEILVHSSGLPYTIIRMYNAFPGLARHRHFVASPVENPDRTTRRHSLSCRQVGDIAARCLFNPEAHGKSFELFADDEGETADADEFIKSIPGYEITPEACFEAGKSWVEPDLINDIFFTRENLNRSHSRAPVEINLEDAN